LTELQAPIKVPRVRAADLRLRRLDGTRMPPLASNVVCPQAVDLVGRWIDAL
jgi:hypothetical protein